MQLTINKAKVIDNRLISCIEYENKKYDMYFEVEKEYAKYLCDETLDAFLVSLIPFIVKHNYDVKINGKISSKLYYQLTNYLLPLLCSEFKKERINIDCEITNVSFDAKGVGASISCGVDSFYTLLKHQNQKDENYNITHLTFFNAGSNGEYGGESGRKLFKERLKFIKKFCNQNNYKLVTIDTNMNELIMMNHKKTHSFRTLGCVLALQKLFGKYYFASGYHYNDMKLDEDSCGHYDTLNVQCLSNETLTIYSSGLEVSRLDKVKYISEHEITYNWLNVCVVTGDNCGECIKCSRTIAELESIGKIDKYKSVFDLSKYYKNRNKIFVNILKESREKDTCDAIYLREIVDECKKNKKNISPIIYMKSYIPNKTDIKSIIKLFLPKKIVNKIKKIRQEKYSKKDGGIN